MVYVMLALATAALVLTRGAWLPYLASALKLECGHTGWVHDRPYTCRRPKWHAASHASGWWEWNGAARRVRWYAGEYGLHSQIDTRALTLVLLVLVGSCSAEPRPEHVVPGAVDGVQTFVDEARHNVCYLYYQSATSCVHVGTVP